MSRTRPVGKPYLRRDNTVANLVIEDVMKRRAATQKQSKGVKKVRRATAPTAGRVGFQPELKSFDTWDTAANIGAGTGSAGHVALLNPLTLGSDRYQRIGRKIQIKKIHVRISLHPATPDLTTVPEDIVIMLVWDKDGNTLPSLPNLLQDVSAGGVVTSAVNSHQNLDESKRYTILKKKVIPLRICGTATGALPCNGAAFQAQNNDLNWSWNLKGDYITQYNANNAGNIGDIANGALVLCWWTNLGVGFTTSNLSYNTRIRYFD